MVAAASRGLGYGIADQVAKEGRGSPLRRQPSRGFTRVRNGFAKRPALMSSPAFLMHGMKSRSPGGGTLRLLNLGVSMVLSSTREASGWPVR